MFCDSSKELAKQCLLPIFNWLIYLIIAAFWHFCIFSRYQYSFGCTIFSQSVADILVSLTRSFTIKKKICNLLRCLSQLLLYLIWGNTISELHHWRWSFPVQLGQLDSVPQELGLLACISTAQVLVSNLKSSRLYKYFTEWAISSPQSCVCTFACLFVCLKCLEDVPHT